MDILHRADQGKSKAETLNDITLKQDHELCTLSQKAVYHMRKSVYHDSLVLDYHRHQ